MKELFTDDPLLIKQEIDALVANKVQLICGRRGGAELKKLPAVAKSKAGGTDLLVLFHPHEPTCDVSTCEFFYRVSGSPLRCFEAVRVKKAADFLGLKYPKAIYSLHQRQYPRVLTPRNRDSTVSCSLRGKQRLYTGTVDDISMQGAKLLIAIPVKLEVGDVLCHLSLVLCSRLSSIYEARLAIHEAKVVWLKEDGGQVHTVGVNFAIEGRLEDVLSNYIDLRSIEDPQDLAQ